MKLFSQGWIAQFLFYVQLKQSQSTIQIKFVFVDTIYQCLTNVVNFNVDVFRVNISLFCIINL